MGDWEEASALLNRVLESSRRILTDSPNGLGGNTSVSDRA